MTSCIREGSLWEAEHRPISVCRVNAGLLLSPFHLGPLLDGTLFLYTVDCDWAQIGDNPETDIKGAILAGTQWSPVSALDA